MSDKVRLPKNVDEAIKSLSTKWTKRAYLQLKNYEHPVHEGAVIIKDYFGLPSDEHGFEKLARALYIGYEVEQTVEEQLEKFYDEQLEAKVEDQVDSYYAIKKTLDIIGMKVTGINA